MARSTLTLILVAVAILHVTLVSASVNVAPADRPRRPLPVPHAHQVAKPAFPAYTCPSADKDGYVLDFHTEAGNPMRCMYKRPVEGGREPYCLYDKESGVLKTEHHNDKCPAAAVGDRASSSRRSRSTLPRSPRKRSAARASCDRMKLRQALGERKHAKSI